ncbi:type IV pilus secretin PilQ [Alkanindiges illinoisensis]|uniref:Type IV pilus secretin PilQ n=1 Tax=Alkanindiges illinoisensis TaxID=197183 RepID=A0A4Y7XCW7_9GAMM|nr:type IV pilus secretin PilQ [Alkanindiges illinoisensis]
MRNPINQFGMGATPAMTSFMRQLTLASACALTVKAAMAAQVSLNQVIPLALPNNETELRLVFSSTPPDPQAYQIEQPTRLVLDFPETISALPSNRISVASKNAQDVSVVTNQERTRLVVSLTEAGNYSTRVEGNTLILKISRAAGTAATSTMTPVVPATINTSIAPVSTDIRNIDFQRGAAGDGLITVDLLNSSLPVDVQQQGSRIVVRFVGAKIPSQLRRRLDVNDFATPVSTIDAYNEGGNGMMVIQPQGEYEYMAYQTDNKLTISVKPAVKPEVTTKARAEEVYTGQKLSLNFQDIDVRSVLQLIADFTNLNLVASDSVNGRITIRLQNVPWDQALDIILKTKGLDKRRTGNVIMVAPAVEIAAREKLEAQAIQQIQQLAPLQTEYIQLSYAKAANIQTLITSGRNNGTSGSSTSSGETGLDNNVGSLLSSRGTISIDPRTNTLIIQDTAAKIDEIRAMISRLDVPVKQVMIEARIVRATNNFSKQMGVKWGVLSQGIGSNNSLLVGGSENTLWNLREPEEDDVTGGYKYTIDRPDNLNVDLGVSTQGASRIAFGLISLSDVMLDLELSALQSEGKGEVVSTPKVLTGDKQKATVASGRQIPYQKSTSSGATSIEFVNAELGLDVTPSITPDGKIGMELEVTNNTIGEILQNGQATIATNRLNTNVLVNDGETVVLGGIFVNETGNTVTKVPFLGDIPYVGTLFRKNINRDDKQELLIFVTPRLVSDTTTRTPK